MSPPALPPYVATVTASAEEPAAPAWGALVRDDNKRWCTNDGVGATLKLTFDRPVSIGHVMLYTDYDGASSMPERIELVTDAKTVTATNGQVYWLDVPLDGSPTMHLTLKVRSLQDLGGRRTCMSELALKTADGSPIPLLIGVPPDGAAALPGFVRDLDAALAACDVKGIAAAFRFPLAATMHFDVRPADRVPKRPVVMKYASARALANACANDGRLLALGYAASFAGDLSSLSSRAPGLVHLGEAELGWRLGWKGGWKVIAADLHDPTFRSDGWGDAPGPVALWISKLGGSDAPSTEETAADALFVALDATSAVVTRERFLAAIGRVADSDVERVTTARAGKAGWMTAVFPVDDGEERVSALRETFGGTSRVLAAFVSRSHSAKRKAGAMAALPALTRDQTLTAHPDVLAAVTRLVSGPLDRVAASRPDLVAIGAGPGETRIGGDKLAPIWQARWANRLTVTGVVGRVVSTGRTAFVVVDATKAKTAYRIAIVLDKTAAGAWSLGHLHIATP